MEVSEYHNNKTKEDVVEKPSSVREAAPLQLRFPRRKRNPWISLARLQRRRRRRCPFRRRSLRFLTIEGQNAFAPGLCFA